MVREIEPWRDARLKCGIGHEQGGRVRLVQYRGQDNDGDYFWYPPSNDYDPDKCIVCGLKIWWPRHVDRRALPPDGPDIGADVPGGGAI